MQLPSRISTRHKLFSAEDLMATRIRLLRTKGRYGQQCGVGCFELGYWQNEVYYSDQREQDSNVSHPQVDRNMWQGACEWKIIGTKEDGDEKSIKKGMVDKFAIWSTVMLRMTFFDLRRTLEMTWKHHVLNTTNSYGGTILSTQDFKNKYGDVDILYPIQKREGIYTYTQQYNSNEGFGREGDPIVKEDMAEARKRWLPDEDLYGRSGLLPVHNGTWIQVANRTHSGDGDHQWAHMHVNYNLKTHNLETRMNVYNTEVKLRYPVVKTVQQNSLATNWIKVTNEDAILFFNPLYTWKWEYFAKIPAFGEYYYDGMLNIVWPSPSKGNIPVSKELHYNYT